MVRLRYKIISYLAYAIFCFQIGSLYAWTYNPFKPKLPEWPIKKTVPHKKKKVEPKRQRSVLPKKTIPSTTHKHYNRRKKTQKKVYKKQPAVRQKTLGVVSPPSLPRLEITGLVWNCERPQAIINNTVVGIGDVIANTKIKVVDIRKGAIDVMFAGKKFTITP